MCVYVKHRIESVKKGLLNTALLLSTCGKEGKEIVEFDSYSLLLSYDTKPFKSVNIYFVQKFFTLFYPDENLGPAVFRCKLCFVRVSCFCVLFQKQKKQKNIFPCILLHMSC